MMRKFFSILISLVLLLSIVPLNAGFPTVVFGDQHHKNDFHTVIIKSLHEAGYEQDGEPIDPDPGNPDIAIPNGRFSPGNMNAVHLGEEAKWPCQEFLCTGLKCNLHIKARRWRIPG